MASDSYDSNLLASLSATPLDEAIPSDDLNLVLSRPPFVTLPGAFNLRDVGAFAPGHVAPGRVFRSGTLDFVPAPQLPSLGSQLGVSTVYDFRRDDEAKGGRREIDGVKLLACPYKDGVVMPPPVVAADFTPAEDGTAGQGYRRTYTDILEGYTTGYRLVFEGLRDGEVVLFHCTGGKDRTGIMAALILDLMGAPPELIGREYVLTRIGMEPFREKLLPLALKAYGGSADASGDEKGGAGNVGFDKPGIRQFLGTDAAAIVEFVDHLQQEYGGTQGYLTGKLGFSEEEVGQIRERLKPSGETVA